MRPVQAGSGEQLDLVAIDPRMHAVAVVLDLMKPVLAHRRVVDEARKLRFDPLRRMSRYWCCGLSFGPQCDGSRINLRTFWHRGLSGKTRVIQTNVRHGILAIWLFESTTIKKACWPAARRIQDPNMKPRNSPRMA